MLPKETRQISVPKEKKMKIQLLMLMILNLISRLKDSMEKAMLGSMVELKLYEVQAS